MPKRKIGATSTRHRSSRGFVKTRRRRYKKSSAKRPFNRRRHNRLMRRIGAELKHATMLTNSDVADSENPTDSRIFAVYNASVGGAYPTTYPIKNHLQLITQGTGQGDRDGNKITIKDWKLTVTVTCIKEHPLFVRMFIGRPKALANNSSSIGSSSWSELLQQGDTTTAPLSTYLTYHQPVNTDYWTIKCDKRFIIDGLTDTDDASGNPDRHLHSSSRQYPGFRRFVFDLTKWYPRNITYDDTTALPRVGKPLFLFFQCCTLGSQSDHSVTTGPYDVYCDIAQTLSFYDV